MATADATHNHRLRTIAELMLAVASESVTMVKRNAPEQALKLKKKDEWGLYLEFLKIMFNLADRLSACYIPVKEQPQFMENLADAVISHLKTVLAPAFGSGSDQMEVVMTINAAVAESRELYEAYRFLITEDSKEKNTMFRDFGERVAEHLGAPGNAQVASAATLCASATVSTMSAIFEGQNPSQTGLPDKATVGHESPSQIGRKPTGNEIKLVSVMSSTKGDEIETRWGLHPRFRQDLTSEEVHHVTTLMNRVAKILGERYAAVAFSDEWATWHRAGHA